MVDGWLEQGDNGSDVNSMLACFWLSSLDSRRNSESWIDRGLKGWERWVGRVCIFIDSLADFATSLIIIISVINQFIPLTISLPSLDYLIGIFEGRERGVRREGRESEEKEETFCAISDKLFGSYCYLARSRLPPMQPASPPSSELLFS